MERPSEAAVHDDGKIECKIDGARVHSVQIHINQYHPDWTIERYMEKFPGEPILSELAKKKVLANQRAKPAEPANATMELAQQITMTPRPMHEVFDLGQAKAAFTASGNPIMVGTFDGIEPELAPFRAEIDKRYIFPIEILKTGIAAIQLNMPALFWGMHGTGKTTIWEQIAARTGRPFVRVQHTINTEEGHILGMYVVRNGATQFQLGPLPLAMLFGGIYCADEYDFAMPSVLSVYQPVMEGKALIIKEAPPEFRVIKPHPNFRFVATGNTNGGGDETGLYQGTLIQNAANYSRFRVTVEVPYMDPKIEANVVSSQTGLDNGPATKLVNFATKIRDAFREGKINTTISPRELISAGTLGIAFGADYKFGLMLAFGNRLNSLDRKLAQEIMDRVIA